MEIQVQFSRIANTNRYFVPTDIDIRQSFELGEFFLIGAGIFLLYFLDQF